MPKPNSNWDGHGFKQNFNSALEWYEKAAAQGNAKARTALGLLYFYGVGVEENTEKAGEWFEKAAAQDDPNAQRYLGLISYNAKDYTQAKLWWEQSAAQGYAPAMSNIGNLYTAGEGVTQDFTEAKGVEKSEKQAIEWAEKSCALETLGSDQACTLIGNSYFEGELGLPKDNQKAFEYSMKAAINGNAGGAFVLRKLEESGFTFPETEKEQASEFSEKFRDKQYWKSRGRMQTLKFLLNTHPQK